MKVNSFFCGAGGFDLGFIQAGFEITGAWDFDKYAVESYRHNIGGAEQADVSKMKGSDVPNTNGWLFGFPCQDISIAGKQKGMIKGETRSGLFYEIMRLLGEVADKPEWILAENVKAVNKLIPEIESEYDKAGYVLISPQLYNSKFEFVPQNRERYFLMGLRKDLAKTFVFPQQQTDFIPKLSSVLEENVDEKYYMSDEKAKVIIERVLEGLKVKQATKLGYAIAKEGDTINISHPNSATRRGRVGKQVAQTILTGQELVVVEPVIVHNIYGGFNEKEPRIFDEYAPTIRTAAGGGHIPSVMESTGCSLRTRSYMGQPQQLEVRSDNISNSVTTVTKDYMTTDFYRIRKLTPRETARLQGFPDSYEQIVSNSQFYKQMGNAVTVNVAYKIAKAIKEQL